MKKFYLWICLMCSIMPIAISLEMTYWVGLVFGFGVTSVGLFFYNAIEGRKP